MRLITLNLFGGRFREELSSFLASHKDTTDIFCFQEVFHGADWLDNSFEKYGKLPDPNLLTTLQTTLPEHIGYFRPTVRASYGIASFIKNGVEVHKEETSFIHKEEGYVPDVHTPSDHARNVQALSLAESTVFNVHGLSGEGYKGDTPERILQSQRLVNYVQGFSGKKVLCGDFNMLPATESMSLIEALPLRNLISEYGITSTRTARYEKEPKYADYILVSPDVAVHEFKVLENDVSDHAPLLLEFS